MPDADPGDLFLCHRGVILDALLSDPYFGASENDTAEESAADAVGAVSARSDVSAPLVDDSLFVLSDSPPLEQPALDRNVLPDDEPVETTSPRRSSVGPSASERINALLSGQSPRVDDDFGPDYAQAAADRINREAQGRQEGTEQTPAAASAANEKPSPQQMVQEVATQLRKPKVALAVAAVVALLIVVLLVFTGGENNEQTRPLAITPAPTSAASPPVDAAETGGTIEVQSAESKCPPGSTEGMAAFSGAPDKAWSCVRAYKVDGQVLRIDLGKEYKVDSIGIVPGWDHVGSDGTDQWTKFRTVSRVSYEFDDGNEETDKTTFTQETLDQRSLVVTKIDPPVTANEIVLTVLKSSGEVSANTVAISSIVITGQ
ncbi:discoidin domain-containing protein [Nocardia flavorosea]|uniref:Discoidin domain-containing protein n=1 Tax=Nocardia flavorosea TaxID=53429 RepID=A0A846YR21_9NOCA|nr:discoidin domain-containing protein [Nocardia flavorosea]NKY59838.1 discoidin domain-containing protein [Nocardia flavorosea]